MQWGVVVQCMWAAGSTQTPPPASAAFRNDPGSPSSESFTIFVQIIHVRKKIADYRHSVVEPVATEAVDRRFRAVIEQFQPKQRRAIKDDRRNRQHADLVATDHGERNRCFRTILGNGAESDVSASWIAVDIVSGLSSGFSAHCHHDSSASLLSFIGEFLVDERISLASARSEWLRTDGAQAGRVRAGFPVTLGLISAFLCRRLQPVCQPLPS